MASVNGLKELINKLQNEAQQILETKIADEIIKVEENHARTDVYNMYDPNIYQRHYSLLKRSNYKISKLPNGISIKNISTHNGKETDYIVEYAQSYDYDYPYAYNQPRPFVQNTKDELEKSKIHIEIIKEELNKKGYNTK